MDFVTINFIVILGDTIMIGGFEMKKRLIGILAGMMILANTLPVFAETIDFDVTVNDTKTNEDNYSRKATKAGNPVYENRFYVTPKTFLIRNPVNVYSKQEAYPYCSSYARHLAPGTENVTVSNPYTGDAPANKIYRLHAYYGGTKAGSARLKGKYTP